MCVQTCVYSAASAGREARKRRGAKGHGERPWGSSRSADKTKRHTYLCTSMFAFPSAFTCMYVSTLCIPYTFRAERPAESWRARMGLWGRPTLRQGARSSLPRVALAIRTQALSRACVRPPSPLPAAVLALHALLALARTRARRPAECQHAPPVSPGKSPWPGVGPTGYRGPSRRSCSFQLPVEIISGQPKITVGDLPATSSKPRHNAVKVRLSDVPRQRVPPQLRQTRASFSAGWKAGTRDQVLRQGANNPKPRPRGFELIRHRDARARANTCIHS